MTKRDKKINDLLNTIFLNLEELESVLKRKPRSQAKSAVTGKYVGKKYAKKHPKTTWVQNKYSMEK